MRGPLLKKLFQRVIIGLGLGIPLGTLALVALYHASEAYRSLHYFELFPPILTAMASLTAALAVSLIVYAVVAKRRISALEEEVRRSAEVEMQMALRTKDLTREVEILSAVRELSRIVSERVVSDQKDAENVFSEILKITEGLVNCEETVLFREDVSSKGLAPWIRRKDGKTEIGPDINPVQIDHSNVREAMMHRAMLQSGDEEGRVSFAIPLVADEEALGVMKVTISTEGTLDERAERIKSCEFVLENFSKHISLTIRKTSLYEHAFLDGLTSLYTKRHFLHQLESNFNYAKRHEKKLALMMIDLDHFKSINDTHGHLTGDNVLRDVAATIKKEIRSYDSAYRYGGEEIGVILPNSTSEEAYLIAERLRKKVEARKSAGAKRERVKVTISLGIAEFASGMRSIQELISRADEALYRAKGGGRNQTVLWNKEMAKSEAKR